MYWNLVNIADDADYTIRLTLTWDVLKYDNACRRYKLTFD